MQALAKVLVDCYLNQHEVDRFPGHTARPLQQVNRRSLRAPGAGQTGSLVYQLAHKATFTISATAQRAKASVDTQEVRNQIERMSVLCFSPDGCERSCNILPFLHAHERAFCFSVARKRLIKREMRRSVSSEEIVRLACFADRRS